MEDAHKAKLKVLIPVTQLHMPVNEIKDLNMGLNQRTDMFDPQTCTKGGECR